MDDTVRTYIESHRFAGMITTRPNGQPHVARCNVNVVDGRIWSSGTENRVRTRNLKRDPRATLFFWGEERAWLAIEANVTMYTGPDGWQKNLELRRSMGRAPDPVAFLKEMEEEGRLIYEFEPTRIYGAYGE
jgi:PPOX class probable F420-dependent enzyme